MDLNKLAEEELIREAKRAVARFEAHGIEGFKKCPLPQTNKRFLTNTIINNIKSNKRKMETQSKQKLRLSMPKNVRSESTSGVTEIHDKRDKYFIKSNKSNGLAR